MLAIDHGYFLGPIHGLEQPLETVKNLLPYTDSLFLTRGVLSSCIPENCKDTRWLCVYLAVLLSSVKI